MGRRAVKASGTARFESQGLFHANSNYAYKGYLSSDTVNQARNLLTLDVSGPVTANNGTTNNGAKLIDMINAISSSTTKTVEIESRWVVFSSTRTNGDVSSLVVHFSIFIDWVHMTADWVYTWGPSVGGSGHVQLDDMGNNVSMVASSNGAQMYLSFRTGPAKEILSIPLPFSINSVFSTSNYGSWSIITDDGINVSAAPTPPAETPTAEVSGIKISELNAVSSLQDDDLFVLSQDNAADGTYDASYNVTLSKMRGRAVLFDGTNGLNVVNIMNLDSNETLTSNQLDFNLTMGTTNTVPDGFGGTKTVDLSSVPATARNILVFASIDSSENEYCSWKYKHPSGSSWIYYIRSQDNGGYPNSNNSAVPLESGGKVDFQFNSSSAFGPLHSLDLHIVGYEL